MNERNYNLLDELIMGFDQGLATLFRPSRPRSERTYPAERVAEKPLTTREKLHSAGLMRVNHAGEVSAQALYQGQSVTARAPGVRDSMRQSALEEIDHLAWCEQRLEELGGQTSLLNPLWYLGSFSLGALAGLFGDKWSLGFITETEHQVVSHLQGHLRQLPPNDERSRAVLQQMQTDEGHHASVAVEAGGVELPEPVKQAMRITSRIMTTTAYRV